MSKEQDTSSSTWHYHCHSLIPICLSTGVRNEFSTSWGIQLLAPPDSTSEQLFESKGLIKLTFRLFRYTLHSNSMSLFQQVWHNKQRRGKNVKSCEKVFDFSFCKLNKWSPIANHVAPADWQLCFLVSFIHRSFDLISISIIIIKNHV